MRMGRAGGLLVDDTAEEHLPLERWRMQEMRVRHWSFFWMHFFALFLSLQALTIHNGSKVLCVPK